MPSTSRGEGETEPVGRRLRLSPADSSRASARPAWAAQHAGADAGQQLQSGGGAASASQLARSPRRGTPAAAARRTARAALSAGSSPCSSPLVTRHAGTGARAPVAALPETSPGRRRPGSIMTQDGGRSRAVRCPHRRRFPIARSPAPSVRSAAHAARVVAAASGAEAEGVGAYGRRQDGRPPLRRAGPRHRRRGGPARAAAGAARLLVH